MNPVALALLAVSLTRPGPPPDDKSPIDSLRYTFGGGGFAGPGGSLTISADGKVSFNYISAPHTDSGGTVVQKTWELTAKERTELFRKLVDDGLLGVQEEGWFFDQIWVTSGRWSRSIAPGKVPQKAVAHLLPYLPLGAPKPAKKPAALGEDEPAAKPGVLASFVYHYSPKAGGDQTTLSVSRSGKAWYVRNPAANSPVKVLREDWTMPAKDAGAVLDALVAGGLFDLQDVGGGKFPSHMIDVQAGPWRTRFHPKELPEKLSKHLRPLLTKADPEFWK